MTIIPLIFLVVLLISNAQSLRRDSTVVYFDNEAPETKESHSILSDMASELIRRSSGTSQMSTYMCSGLANVALMYRIQILDPVNPKVEMLPNAQGREMLLSGRCPQKVFHNLPRLILNVNLANLLLLLVLKAIVYGAGYIGNPTPKGRGEMTDEKILSEGEAALALGYLIGDTCLYRAACEVPETAKGYLGAADIVFKSMKLMPSSLQIGDSYKHVMQEFQKAIEHGLKNQCPSHYYCKKENIHRFLRPQ